MAGHILLAGGDEFGGRMAEVDMAAIAAAGGRDAPIRIIPTAAAADQNHERAGATAERWFRSLGARDVAIVPVIDARTAADPQLAARIASARLIYMLGGFPAYLGETLAGSAAWEGARAAYDAGAVLAGSSAGAMVLCEWYYDPPRDRVLPGLGMVPGVCVLPHHDTYGAAWAPRLAARLPDATLLGIDERTGAIGAGMARERTWAVYGQGMLTSYTGGAISAHAAGEQFRL
jgi:cyanophycinase